MLSLIKKLVSSFALASGGLREAYRRDLSFRMEVWAGSILVVFGYVLWPMSGAELLFLFLAFSLILVAELINTALESALERLHPEEHELIGRSKDIASAAVFITVIFALITIAVIILDRTGLL